MKKFVIKGIVYLSVFIAAAIITSIVMNQGNTDMTMEMRDASMPLVYMNLAGRQVNCMHGYSEKMEESYMRDSITPVQKDRKVAITVAKYDQNISNISYEVRSVDGERLVESTEITDYTEGEKEINASFQLKDLIGENEEYNLVVVIALEDGRTIRYYTRIILVEEYYLDKKIDFVLDFHNKTFDKEQAKDLTLYLESNKDGDNSTFSNVDIHSSFAQITWGNLEVDKVSEPSVTIKEIAEQTASVKLEYLVTMKDGETVNYYKVNEFYRIRYTPARMYLLSYNRTMQQIFNEAKSSFANNKLMIGISTPDVEMVESDGGNVFAFVNANRLFSYNVADNKLARLFSFYDKEDADERTLYNQLDIKILSVEETGNITFLVAGYMNRGTHEGQVGAQVYYYNSLLNTVEEEAFIASTKSPEILMSDIDKLSYMNKDNELFIMMDGAIYRISMAQKKCETVVSGLAEGSYEVSASNKMVVWQKENKKFESSVLVLLNLNTMVQTEIKADDSEYIKPLGFMKEDLIYGTAFQSDIQKDNTGNIIFPMHQVIIQNENGDQLKKYEKAGSYIVSCSIENNQISLKRVLKSEDGTEYIEDSDDQITNNDTVEEGNNFIVTATTDTYDTVVQIEVKNTINAAMLKFLTPQEVMFEGERELNIPEEENRIDRYYVYGMDGIQAICTDANEAIQIAYSESGSVINDTGAYVWAKGNLKTKNQIMAIEGQAISDEKSSLAVCLDTILGFEGVVRNTEYMLEEGNNAYNILSQTLDKKQVLDLSGCNLESVLFFVNQDIPVLAIMNDGNAVLIIGFNEQNIVIMDPLTGTVFKKGMNDSIALFDENGNRFISYIKK